MDPTTVTALTTGATAGAAWLWSKYATEIGHTLGARISMFISRGAKAGMIKAWEAVNWDLAAVRYKENIKQLYGTTRVLGKPDPIPLEGIFTDVYILDKPSAFRRFDIAQLVGEPDLLDKTHTRIDGMTLVKQQNSHRLYILGKPGAGKTTFLKYLVLQSVQGRLNKIPIFVSLKEWSDSQTPLLAFLTTQFDICGFPEAEPFVQKILEKGDAIVLFDGLDEVKEEQSQREKIIATLRDFTNRYRRTQCLITCRIAATDYSFDQFYYVELADFTDDQIKIYVQKWFQERPRKIAPFFMEFEKADNRNLRELARAPLLLGLLCLAFEEVLRFPQRRVELYEEAVEALLKKWDASRAIQRDYRGLELGRKRQMFAYIAAKTFQENQYFIPEQKLAAEIVDYLVKLPNKVDKGSIDGLEVLKAIEEQHGIFSERAARIYSFSHLTFQEYFTARQIVFEDTSGKALRGLLKPEHITDSRWREVILMTASLLADADEYFGIMQQSINDLVASDLIISELLRRSHAKASTANMAGNQAIVRCFYTALALDLDFDRAVGATRVQARKLAPPELRDPYSARNTGLPSDVAVRLAAVNDIGLGQSRSLIRSLVCDLASNLDLDLGLDLDLDITRARGPFIGGEEMGIDFRLNRLLRYAWHARFLPIERQKYHDYFQLVSQQAGASTKNKLAARLATLTIPIKPRNPEWEEFAAALQGVIQQERGIGYEYTFTKEQYGVVAKYFSASKLLLDALDIAAVTDRQKIKEELLIPPG